MHKTLVHNKFGVLIGGDLIASLSSGVFLSWQNAILKEVDTMFQNKNTASRVISDYLWQAEDCVQNREEKSA